MLALDLLSLKYLHIFEIQNRVLLTNFLGWLLQLKNFECRNNTDVCLQSGACVWR